MSSSNQVYNNSDLPSPNVYISQAVQPAPGGGITTTKLTLTGAAPQMTLTQAPATSSVGGAMYVTRNLATGAIETANPYFGTTLGRTTRYLAVDAPIANAAITAVPFDTGTSIDPGVTYAAGVFTVVQGGTFFISFSASFAAGAPGGVRWAWIEFASASPQRFGAANSGSEDPFVASVCGSTARALSPGDTISVFTYQANPGFAPINLLGLTTDGADNCQISIVRLVV